MLSFNSVSRQQAPVLSRIEASPSEHSRNPSLAEVPASEWDGLISPGSGPLKHGYLLAWEQSELRGLTSRPVLLFGEDSALPAAACPGYLYDLDVPTTRAPQLTGLVGQLRRVWPGLLYIPTYELGSPTPLTNPFLVADPQARGRAASDLIEAGIETGTAAGAQFMLVQNFARTGGPVGEELRRRNFARIPILPTAVVHLGYGSFEEYLGAMRAQYRRRAQQALKRSASLCIEHVRDFAGESEDLARLWRANYERAREVRREILPPAYFRATAGLPETSALLARREDNSLAAFALLFEDHPWLSFMQCGFEQTAGRGEGAYFRLLYEIVRAGIEGGFEQLDLGLTTLGPKLDIGAVPVPLHAWLKHRNPIFQRFIMALAKGPLSPPEVSPRHVFKEAPPGAEELVQRRGLIG